MLCPHRVAHGDTDLEGGQVESSEAVEEPDALGGHLHRALTVGLPGAGGARVRDGAVEEGAVEHVQDPREVCGPQRRRQSRGVLAMTVEDAVRPDEKHAASERDSKGRHFHKPKGKTSSPSGGSG